MLFDQIHNCAAACVSVVLVRNIYLHFSLKLLHLMQTQINKYVKADTKTMSIVIEWVARVQFKLWKLCTSSHSWRVRFLFDVIAAAALGDELVLLARVGV